MASSREEIALIADNDSSGELVGNSSRVCGSCKRLVPDRYLKPYILVTTCFALWGFANDVTNPMVNAFSTIFLISNAQSSLVQFAFYLGYGCTAIPAAIVIQNTSYKRGLLIGLGLYAIGTLCFFPASLIGEFWSFLLAYFVMTCGLAFLETSANPFILSLGDSKTATQRLNLSQAMNPVGSLCGMVTAQQAILSQLSPYTEEERREMDPEQLKQVTYHDMAVVRGPYLAIGMLVLLWFCLLARTHVPNLDSEDLGSSDAEKDDFTEAGTRSRQNEGQNQVNDESDDLMIGGSRHGGKITWNEVRAVFNRLFAHRPYRFGMMTQFCYVGAQIMCWTFIIHYGKVELDMTASEAQSANIVAMCLFCLSRFVFTYVLTAYQMPAARLLFYLGAGASLLMSGCILLPGWMGLGCLVLVSVCMSAMFPTIYGLALRQVGRDNKLGSAGLVMSIVGGSILPVVQGALIDTEWTMGSLNSVRISFILPLLCFLCVCRYGHWAIRNTAS